MIVYYPIDCYPSGKNHESLLMTKKLNNLLKLKEVCLDLRMSWFAMIYKRV